MTPIEIEFSGIWWYHTNPRHRTTRNWERNRWRRGFRTTENPPSKGPVRKYMSEMKRGDVLVWYSSGDIQKVLGIGEVVRGAFGNRNRREDYPKVQVRKQFLFPSGVPLAMIKQDRITRRRAKGFSIGRFFRLSRDEYEAIRRLAEQTDPSLSSKFNEIKLPNSRLAAKISSRREAKLTQVMEGQEYRAEVIFQRRNWKLIEEKKIRSDYSCEVCGIRFEDEYGDIGKDYIIAHHKIPISGRKKSSKTTLSDIALVCANCHSMMHRENPPLDISELRHRMKNTARSRSV